MLHGCEDHWTLQDRTSMPLLFQMTVCVDIRVTVPGSWVAFSYSSVHAPRPELGLEGDDKAVYGWLLRVRHRFPVELSPTVWHRVCLRRDVPRNSFSLEVTICFQADINNLGLFYISTCYWHNVSKVTHWRKSPVKYATRSPQNNAKLFVQK